MHSAVDARTAQPGRTQRASKLSNGVLKDRSDGTATRKAVQADSVQHLLDSFLNSVKEEEW